MAFNSVLGVATKIVSGQGLQPGVYENWLAAAPVVALGAPLGVYIMARIGQKLTLLIVAALCVAQFIWMLFAEQKMLGMSGTIMSLSAVVICLGGFEILRHWGAVRVNGRGRNRDIH